MKKIISAIVATIILSTMSANVFAEAYGTGLTRAVLPVSEVVTNADDIISEENRLKEVLTKVRLLIDIPEEYTEFDYNLYTRYEKENWDFNWHTEDYTKSVNVSSDGEGNITYYDSYIRPVILKAPTVYKEQALETAYEFIQKLYPEIIDELSQLTNSTDIYFGSNAYRFNFQRVVNGIEYSGNNISISVDHTDGRVRSFSINWDSTLEFDKPEGIISSYDAADKWEKDSVMELKYRIFSNYENGEYKDTSAKLVYLNRDEQQDILALTGEYLETDYGWAENDSDKTMFAPSEDTQESVNSSASGSLKLEFSQSELDRMEELAGYIKIGEADEIVRGFEALGIDESFTLSSYSTGYSYQPYTDTAKRPVVWNLRYTGTVSEGDFNPLTAQATVNAVTGELISFSCYRYYDYFDQNGNFVKPVLKLEKQAAQDMADDFLKQAQPEKYTDLELSSATATNSFNYSAKSYGNQDTENDGVYHTALSARYNRTYNGIQVMGNTASVTVDCVSGKITNYSVSWTENLEFEAEKAEIDEKTALDIYFSNSDTALKYVHYTVYLYDQAAQANAKEEVYYGKYSSDAIKTRDETRLVYSFNCPFYGVCAVSGKPLDYNGEAYEKIVVTDFDGFNDIDGHWAEDKIKLLADIGVVIPDDSFCPDKAITQKEFMAMLIAVTNSRSYIVRYEDIDLNLESIMAEMRHSNYYIPENDEDIQPDSPLMRKDAAKFIMRGLGYEKIATLGNIFKTDFADNDSIDKDYIGYAALAQALGIINGSHGCFNGDENITRAESVILIYNYMNADK